MQELADNSNKLFKGLKTKGSITKKELKYFTIDFKKAINLGKLHLLPKIHRCLENVPGRPVISNCGTPTEIFLEFLDSQLKPVMQTSRSCMKHNISTIPKDSILVMADVVGLYPSISHEAEFKALGKALNNRTNDKVSTEDLLK